jgi:hypothetical protein
MGYIALTKASSAVDLIPAEGIVKVSEPDGSGDITITYNFNGQSANTLATLEIEAASDLTIADRNAINVAICKANGAAGPAIPLTLSSLVTAVKVA